MSSTCSHNMANFGRLEAEIGSGVWGTPANFNEFRVLASLLERRRSSEANQTLHDIWRSPGLLHYIYIFGGPCPLTEFRQVLNSLCVQVMRSPILAALLHGTRAAAVSQTLRRGTRNALCNFRRRRHLYSAGWPSRWASAHILVQSGSQCCACTHSVHWHDKPSLSELISRRGVPYFYLVEATQHLTRMLGNALCDGRPAEYRWRPVQRRKVWLTPTTRVPCSNAAKTRNPLKFARVPQTPEQISAVSGPKFTIF